MPNYDMSDTACRERVEAAQRLDKLDKAVELLAHSLEDIIERQHKQFEMIVDLHKLTRLNRESINAMKGDNNA